MPRRKGVGKTTRSSSSNIRPSIGAFTMERNAQGGINARYDVPESAKERFKKGFKKGSDIVDAVVTKVSEPAGFVVPVVGSATLGILAAYKANQGMRAMSSKYKAVTDWVGSTISRAANAIRKLDFHTATPAEKVAMSGSGTFTLKPRASADVTIA